MWRSSRCNTAPATRIRIERIQGISAVPEAESWVLLLAGLGLLGLTRRILIPKERHLLQAPTSS